MANTPTENEYFQKPAKGDLDWDDENNGNWDAADQQLVSRKVENLLINGRFDIWQRGDSHQQGDFFADRWVATVGGNVSVTWNKFDNVAHGVNFDPHSAFSLHAYYDNSSSVGDSIIIFENRIPNPERFSGKRICVSFEVTGPNGQFVVDGFVNYGDKPTVWFPGSIVTCNGNITRNVVFFDVPDCPTDASITEGNFISIRLLLIYDGNSDVVMPDTTNIFFTNVALTISDVYIPVAVRSVVEEKRLCYQFYQKDVHKINASQEAANYVIDQVSFAAVMRKSPSITVTDTGGSSGIDGAPYPELPTPRGFRLVALKDGTTGAFSIEVNWIANAEF
jgi:hypothetical protein